MKKKKVKTELLTEDEARELQTKLSTALENDFEYLLEVDPENKYGMSEEQKKFISNYINFKSIALAADFSGIDMDTAKAYFVSYSSQQEIRRINRALYHRQFSNKLLTLDQIGGYLTSLLTDGVPLADRLPSKEKIKIAQMLIDLNVLKLESFNNPSIIMSKDLDLELQNLSVETIKQLLETSDKEKIKEKKKIVNNINNELSIEEKTYLENLPTKDLLEILEKTSSGGNNDK